MGISDITVEWERKGENPRCLHLLNPIAKYREHSSRPMALKVGSQDQQHQHRPGTCLKCTFSGSAPESDGIRNSGSGAQTLVLTGPPVTVMFAIYYSKLHLRALRVCAGKTSSSVQKA